MSAPAPKIAPFADARSLCAVAPLFNGISEALLTDFVAKASLRTAPKGKVLFLQGDDADWFYLIVRGWVKLFRETIEGTEAVIDVLTNGHMFGDSAVFSDGCYGYGAQVVEECQYIALPASLLKKALQEDKQIAMNMLSNLSQESRQQQQEIEHLNLQAAPQRIGCFLLRLCPADSEAKTTLNLPYDKALLAGRLGMKPETFSRALNKLKSETGITVSGPTVVIHDMTELVHYTCNHCSSAFPCEGLE